MRPAGPRDLRRRLDALYRLGGSGPVLDYLERLPRGRLLHCDACGELCYYVNDPAAALDPAAAGYVGAAGMQTLSWSDRGDKAVEPGVYFWCSACRGPECARLDALESAFDWGKAPQHTAVSFNQSVLGAIQDRTVARVFRDALYPRLSLRGDPAK